MDLTTEQLFIIIIFLAISLILIKIVFVKYFGFGVLNNKKTTYDKLKIGDIFGLVEAMDLTKSNDEIVDSLFVIIEPHIIIHQEGKKANRLIYTSTSLKDGKYFDFQDDTIVYHYYNFNSKLKQIQKKNV